MITDQMLDAAENAYLDNLPQGADRVVYTAAMRAALEAAERAAWRPIEEAPTTDPSGESPDVHFLVPDNPEWFDWREHRPPLVMALRHHYQGRTFVCADNGEGFFPEPTHFRPLPKGPEE
jgi:hypothetical protein